MPARAAADDAATSRAGAVALGNRKAERFDRRQVGRNMLVDLEGAGDAERTRRCGSRFVIDALRAGFRHPRGAACR